MLTADVIVNDAQIPVIDAKWTTEREGKAAQLTFKYPRHLGVSIGEGNNCIFNVDGQSVYVGFAFDIRATRDDLIEVVCYDQMRYLQANYTYMFNNLTLDQIVSMICTDFGLVTGSMTGTGVPLKLVYEDKKLVDMIEEARGLTMDESGRIYQVWCDKGLIRVSQLPGDRMTDLVIGHGSLLTDYDYKRSINDDTYNRVTLMKKDEKTGEYIVVKETGGTIKDWGTLQYFEVADEKMTQAEMEMKAKTILQAKNRVKQTLVLQSLGDLSCEAGASVYVNIPDVDTPSGKGLEGWALIDKAVHEFSAKADHAMKLTMHVTGGAA